MRYPSSLLFAGLMLALLAVLLCGVTVVGEVVLFLVRDLTSAPPLAMHLLMVMLPYMPLVCMVALVGAVLQTHGRFGPSAASPIITAAARRF